MDLVWRGGSSDAPGVDLTAPGISFSGSRGTWRSPLEGPDRSAWDRNERGRADRRTASVSDHRAEHSTAQQRPAQPGDRGRTGGGKRLVMTCLAAKHPLSSIVSPVVLFSLS
ncbi:hypothetical protein V8C26DRAFT_396369 [Trichoderma gracile]